MPVATHNSGSWLSPVKNKFDSFSGKQKWTKSYNVFTRLQSGQAFRSVVCRRFQFLSLQAFAPCQGCACGAEGGLAHSTLIFIQLDKFDISHFRWLARPFSAAEQVPNGSTRVAASGMAVKTCHHTWVFPRNVPTNLWLCRSFFGQREAINNVVCGRPLRGLSRGYKEHSCS